MAFTTKDTLDTEDRTSNAFVSLVSIVVATQ
jgi:hypothetical protein